MDKYDKLTEQLRDKKKRLLDSLILNEILIDKRLIKAFMDIPLERFIPEKFLNVIKLYEDVPNLFYFDEQNPRNYRTISAPHMITIMLQGLTLNSNDDLLILGAKSGYIAALAHELSPKGEIIILEANSEIAKITANNLKDLKLDDKISIIVKNPLFGMPDLGPWQKILVTGAIEQSRIHSLLQQLDEEGGVLFAPIGPEFMQIYTQILRQKDQFYGKKQLQVKFSPLITQVELDELELITDIDEIEIANESKVINRFPNLSTKKVNIKYTSEILDKIVPEDQAELQSVDETQRDEMLSNLNTIEQNIKKLKKEENIQNSFEIIDEIELKLDSLKNFKKLFEIKVKRMQNILNQIRSYNIIRKELEKSDLQDTMVIDKKIE
ncbi:MAG: protein-L-isoaspartate O-methyltransferase, partial [Promethearchaeota archaeon]